MPAARAAAIGLDRIVGFFPEQIVHYWTLMPSSCRMIRSAERLRHVLLALGHAFEKARLCGAR
jgi:hypothetical protein